MADVPVILFTHDPRRIFSRFYAHRLINDTSLFRVITHLYVAGNRKIFAERVTDESVIRQNAAQIRVAIEDDAVQVEGLSLIPIGTRPDTPDGVDDRKSIILGESPEAQTPVMGQG